MDNLDALKNVNKEAMDFLESLNLLAGKAQADAKRIKELESALRWLTEMSEYANGNFLPEWERKNGGDFDSALSQARSALMRQKGA